jgi:subtilisin family serine protease
VNDWLPNDLALPKQRPDGGVEATYPERPSTPDGPSTPDRPTTPDRPVPAGTIPAPSGQVPTPVSRPVDGLPDAATVLDILRRMPRGPGSFVTSSVNSGPNTPGPKPRGTVQVSPGKSSPPRRVVAVSPGQVFVPRPKPRPAAGPLAVVGAIVAEVREREVIVTLAAGANDATVEELGRAFGLDGSTLYTSTLLGTRVVRFRIRDTRSIADVVQQLSTDARVQTSQPNYVFTATQAAVKAAPLSIPQYAPQKLHLAEAHRIAQGKGVKIAVIDTAIDATHPALSGAITASFDALGETKPEPELHGTSITGIVGARSELMGTAPAASILSVRAFAKGSTASAQSHTLAILKGLDWAVLNGARVINMSFAGPNDPILGQAIAAAVKQGAVIVAAAGNGGPDALAAYPGAYPNVIAVTAIDSGDALYKSANRGTYISIAAPGVDVIGAALKGAYEMSSGTSMAAAHVSGIAALMIEKNPKSTPKDIRDGLSKSARQIPRLIAEEMGAGIVDAEAALKVR